MSQELSTTGFSFSDLASALQTKGLEILGSFPIDEGEILLPERSTQPAFLAIVGNVGSAVWPPFEEARRHRPDLSLDGWTEEVVGDITATFGVEALYPFKGPPYHPFIRWARRTGTLFASPIGLTIHPVHGLWLAFRAALLIGDGLEGRPQAKRQPAQTSPCDDCIERPCLTTCPVGAFTREGYDFAACIDHLATTDNACRSGGCLARIACPVGREDRYQPAHAAFHMEQLLKAHGRS